MRNYSNKSVTVCGKLVKESQCLLKGFWIQSSKSFVNKH